MDHSLTTYVILGIFFMIFLQVASMAIFMRFFNKKTTRPVATNGEKAKLIEKMNQELSNAFNDISLLYTVSQYLSAVLEMEDLHSSIKKIFCERFPCDGFALLFSGPVSDGMGLAACKGLSLTSADETVWPVTGIVEHVLRKANSCYWHDSQKVDFAFSSLDQDLIRASACGAVLALPLKVHGDVLGVLILTRSKAFTLTERQSLEAIASQIAMTHERVKLYTKTKELAVRDELTGVYNRRHFHSILQRECQRSQRYGNLFCLLVIDVDNFKHFNDSLGHLKGDELLKQLTLLLQKNIREIDVLARIGGEEFVILLTDVSLEQGAIVADQLRKLVKTGLCLDEKFPVTISIGVAGFPAMAEDAFELINAADMALYLAKREGKDRVCVYQREGLAQTETARLAKASNL